jgi:hypothetical protein
MYISNSKADIAQVNYKGTGNFIPVENCSLILTNASVIFNIEHKTTRINVGFEGNYTIYNPGESLNITLVAPFSSDFYNLESTCIMKVGGNITTFSYMEINLYDYETDTEHPWREYLEGSHEGTYRRKFIVINTTVVANSSIEIECSFDAYTVNPNSVDVIEIYYDVGTSRVWNGTISERVEFKVHGKLPNSYSDYREYSFEYNCTITDLEDGKSYAWEWVNEVITANRVFISFSTPWGPYALGRLSIIIIPSVIAAMIILAFIYKRRRKKRAA